MTLRELGEDALVRRIRKQFKAAVAVPIGDDAAVFDIPAGQSLVFCSDLIAENTHFVRTLHPPDSVGYKAVAVNVSDIGAMGGIPMHFLISLAAPPDLEVGWIDGFLSGVARACDDFEVSLVGGDSSSAGLIFIDVSMIGRVGAGQAVRRSGAKPGDSIYVTGALGSSALGLELLRSGNVSDVAVKRHLYPRPRNRVGAAVSDKAHAMIDISDGLSSDLTHVLEESAVSARIYLNRLPAWQGAAEHQVLHGGEEYELIIVAADLPAIVAEVPLTRIGEIIDSVADHQVLLVDDNREYVVHPRGWRHFG